MNKVIIVDDHKIFRNGFKLMLDSLPNVELVGEACNGEEFLELIDTTIPDLVFMDINMPKMNGMIATQKALEKYPDIKIIALTAFLNQEYVEQMLMHGVEGFMLKNSELDEFEAAVNKVLSGGNYFSAEILKIIMNNINRFNNEKREQIKLPDFSPREKEILQYICQGLNNEQISSAANISVKTVEKHKSTLFLKTETANTVNLVIYAFKHGLVEV